MNISSDGFTIQMTGEELWNTAFDVRNALYNTIGTHWINHQDVWEEREKERLHRLKTMWSHLGRLDLYDEIKNKAEDIFRDFNKGKK